MAKNSLALPDHLVQLLSAAEARHGLPAGTMFSVMQQEIGGQTRFLDDPTAYHYEAGPDGRRVAPHTGKISTAFGPFGILESTAKDPGYGVAPLKNKSIEEQIRFATEYAAARTRHAGGNLKAGLAGYGQGIPYAEQVMGRLPGAAQPSQVTPLPATAVASIGPVPEIPAQAVVASPPAAAAPVEPIAPVMPDYAQDPWQEFLRTRFAPEGTTAGLVVPASEPVKPKPQAMPMDADFAQLASMDVSTRPNFGVFQGLARLGARRIS